MENTNKKESPWIQKRLNLVKWDDVKDRTVLDIGCNDGLMINESKRMGAKRAVGVDISEGLTKVASEFAKENNLDVEYWNINAESKEFYSLAGSFDVIFFMAMINHMKDGAKMLEWISDHCNYSFYFGTNFCNNKDVQIKKVKEYAAFNNCSYLGESGNLPNSYHLFRCTKIGKQYSIPEYKSFPTTFVNINRIIESADRSSISYPELEDSIKNIGIKEPIILKRLSEDFFKAHPEKREFDFTGGEGGHRFQIMKRLGYKYIPCKIINY